MKLVPKAKPIRIRISSGGIEHSSIETLRDYFDFDDILSLLKNGGMERWLNQVGEHKIKEELDKLNLKDKGNLTDEERILLLKIFYPDEKDISLVAQRIAHNYESSENLEKIIQWHELAVRLGNSESALELGRIYTDGLYGAPKSYSQAADYYLMAAKTGSAKAQYRLGELYNRGDGVEKSTDDAIKWLEKAAEANYIEAYCLLGEIFAEIEKYEEAQKWLELAINNGKNDAGTMTVLGICLIFLDKSDARALRYLEEAAAVDDSEAQTLLGYIYKNGLCGVEKSDTNAVKWFESAADNGVAEAQFELGNCYKEGIGFNQNYSNAIACYKQAVQQGHSGAKLQLALCYIEDDIMPQTAYNLMNEVADENIPDAQWCMGKIYENGLAGKSINITTAIKWYKKAAKNGFHDAEVALEKLKEAKEDRANKVTDCDAGKGNYTKESLEKAIKRIDFNQEPNLTFHTISQAAEAGNPEAQYQLGRIYHRGLLYSNPNMRLAANWYRKAAANGHVKAATELKRYGW